MAENVLKLKKRAVALGMSKDKARGAERKELEAFISSAESGKKSGGKKKDTPAKKKDSTATSKKKSEKKSGGKKSSGDKKAPAAKKSGKKSGEAKRPSSKKSGSTKKSGENKSSKKSSGAAGRAAIGSIDYDKTHKDWQPKKGGPVERLFKALKKRNGNVEKALADLAPDVWDFVGKKMRDGTKRSKDSGLTMLRYRLNRTKYEFAKATRQHKSATNRVEYGKGQYASTKKAKAKPKADKPKKADKKKSPAKGGKKKSGGKKK